MSISFTVNGTRHELDVEPEMPLLWALRDELGLTGTKFGCGVAACGACTVHVDGMAMRSCVTPVEMVDAENPQPTDEDIDAAITNICRCGTYPRIRAAIRDVTSA